MAQIKKTVVHVVDEEVGYDRVTVQPSISVAAITGTIAGAVGDGALQAIPDLADTPASVDALRDDLVANALLALRNNLQEILDQLASLRSALRAHGLID